MNTEEYAVLIFFLVDLPRCGMYHGQLALKNLLVYSIIEYQWPSLQMLLTTEAYKQTGSQRTKMYSFTFKCFLNH